MRTLALTGLVALLTVVSACTEKPQSTMAKVAGAPAYQGTGVASFTDAGWKAGDATSWEEQMRRRSQSQNEYVRSNGN